MQVLLVVAGALVGLTAGWLIGRAGRPADPPVVEPGIDPPSSTLGFADLVESHPSGVVVSAPDGAITYRNQAARAIAGTHAGVLLDEAIERLLEKARRGHQGNEVLEMYGPPKMVLAVDARPAPDGGAVAFVEDISERRRVEQVRTDFVANISHELKTPVGAMSVLAETLEDESDPDTVRRVVARIMAEAQRASRTIDDLMELSRIELRDEREIELVPVAVVVRGAVERVAEMANRRGIRIVTHGCEPGSSGDRPPPVIEGDRRQLVSALGNLVENAVKYSEPGGLVEVRAVCDGPWLELVVTDDGVGIPQRDLDRIFERFYRVDRARSRGTGGTGLGLSIVRHVANNHHGEIEVTSTEGEGSTFVLRLPMPDGEPADAAPASASTPSPTPASASTPTPASASTPAPARTPTPAPSTDSEAVT